MFDIADAEPDTGYHERSEHRKRVRNILRKSNLDPWKVDEFYEFLHNDINKHF